MTAVFDFDRPIDRRGTASLKWDKYSGRDVIPLWVADMDFAAPEAVLEALRRRIDHGVLGYGHPPASLVDAVRQTLRQRYDWEVRADWIIWLPGLVTGINVACRAVGNEGDAVISAVPVYPPFLTAPKLARRTLISVPLKQGPQGWRWDLEDLEAHLTPQTRLLLLCSPHNPVGRVFRHAELEALVSLCARHDVIVCSDEIHGDLILDRNLRHRPTASVNDEALKRCITLMAPSKTFNIPGLSCSFAVIADKELGRRFRRAMAGIVPDVNVLGFAAAEAAYRHAWPWQQALVDYLRCNRDFVCEALDRLAPLKTTLPEATYLAWIDARGLGIEDPAGFFEAAGVGLSDGKDFGAAGWLRLNFGCPRRRLAMALDRMRQALAARRDPLAKPQISSPSS